jgi:hypothetical protein
MSLLQILDTIQSFPVSGGEIMRTANTTLNEAEIMQKK